MKKIFAIMIIVFSMCLYSSASFATSVIDINGLTEEEIIQQYEQIKRERDRIKAAKNTKVEIIKNNNKIIEELKVDALDAIQVGYIKVNNLLDRIQKNEVVITTTIIRNLTEILEVIQTANQTIKEEANDLIEIQKMMDYAGYDSSVLTVLDSAIEKQNSIIVSYKQIISKLNQL